MAAKSNVDLIEENKGLREQVKTLEEQVTALNAELSDLKSKPAAAGLGPGWLIFAPNKGYNGRTSGIMFRNGRAYVPRVEGMEKVVREMASDFGYTFEAVESFEALPSDMKSEMNTSMIDMLTMPTMI